MTFVVPLMPSPAFFFVESEIPRIVNFLLFVGVLIYFLRKPLIRYFAERLEGIRRDITEASSRKESVQSRLRGIETRIARLDAEIAELKSSAEREALAEKERIHSATTTDLEKLRATTNREIAGVKSAALLQLKIFTADRAVELAEALIRTELKEEDHRRLIRDFTDKLGELAR